ncbi:MAG: hypothetical protein IPP72_04610 [Chitinophagaceae bacterium]|nr:hypothetical protein [Chitinophagaceae bacterium]
MKKHIYYFILAVSLFTACKKNDGPISENIKLERTPQPQVNKSTGSQAIDVLNLNAFNASFTVGVYNTGDAAPTKMDVVIRKNGLNSSVKVLQAAVTTFPSTFTLTTAQLATIFGTPVVLNDSYDISADVYTQSGKKFEAYPTIPGVPSAFGFGSGVASQPGASLSIQYKAICAYNPSIYEGNFVVVTDDWADYLPGDVVELTRIDDTHISFEHIAAVNPVPIVITVNPGDNGVSIPKQSVGTRWAYGAIYTAPFVLTAGGSAQNFVSPCDQTITLNMQYGYSAGTFGGTYPLVLVKQ